ncbi:hypothetical protein M432DRAFT_102125 [Thermoascus aurantiacus ATCC 26904]
MMVLFPLFHLMSAVALYFIPLILLSGVLLLSLSQRQYHSHVSPPRSGSPESDLSQQALSLSSQDGITDTGPNLKYVRRNLRRQVLRTKITPDMVKRAIQLYDLEESYTSQSPEAMAELECLFGINNLNLQWPSENFSIDDDCGQN